MRNGRASRTSQMVAYGLIQAAADPRFSALVSSSLERDTAALVAAVDPLAALKIGLTRRRWFQRLVAVLEPRLWPGARLHPLLRKLYVQAQVDAGLRTRGHQLVVLGAGLDALALRRARADASRRCLEVDHPSTQLLKQRALVATGQPSNLALIAADFENDGLDDVLQQSAWFRPDLPTVFVAEGLLMYLTPSRVARLFEDAATIAAPGSRFVLTHLSLNAKGRPTVGRMNPLVRTQLGLYGEPFRWGIAAAELASWLADRGWRLTDHPSAAELSRRYLGPHGLHHESITDFERFAVACRC